MKALVLKLALDLNTVKDGFQSSTCKAYKRPLR